LKERQKDKGRAKRGNSEEEMNELKRKRNETLFKTTILN
jgi:hypothetical protein